MADHAYVPTVLYIEDDEATAWAFQSIARENNCNLAIVIAADRDVAMSVLAKEKPYQNVKTPDLILLDLDLPKLNGFQIFAELKGMNGFDVITVVFFSSSQRPTDRRRAIDMGALAYIHKPLDLDGFSIAIDQICALISPVT